MLAPFAIQYRQQDFTLKLPHSCLAEFGLAAIVGLLGVGLKVLNKFLNVLAIGILVKVQTNRIYSPNLVPHCVKVPVLRVTLGVLADARLNNAVGSRTQLSLNVSPLQDFATVAIDDVTLTVHDIVVLKDVLSHLEVLRFDLLLGTLNLSRHPLRFDGHVLGHFEGHHGTVNDLGLE